MSKRIRPDEVGGAKVRIRALLRANSRIDSLTDSELKVLELMIQKELRKRGSEFSKRGYDSQIDLV